MKRGNGDPGTDIGGKPPEWSCAFDGAAVIEEGGTLSFRCELPISGCIDHWGQKYRFNEPVVVDARVAGDISGLGMDLALEARAEVDCARCLEPTLFQVSEKGHIFFKPLPEDKGDQDKADSAGDGDDLVFVPSIEGEIDISDQVWEYLVVSLPEKVLCSEGCLGLCPSCGKNRNRGECSCPTSGPDPRLGVLADLMKDGNDEAPGKGGNSNGNAKE